MASVERRAAQCDRLNIRFVQVVVPEKLTILSRHCTTAIVNPELSPAVQLDATMAQSRTRSRYVDLVRPLRAAAARCDVYLRTDSHWNFEGCLIAYSEICAALRVTPRHDLADRPFQTIELALDLGNKFEPQITQQFRLYNILQNANRSSVNELVTAFVADGGKGPLTGTHAVYNNGSKEADGRRLLIFGDSYAHFDPLYLTAMFAETFREVVFVWSTSVDWHFVEEVRPDILICELAERYLRVVPSDRFDLRATVARRTAR
jgi:hypothetical protein